jgi:peptidoglycan/LPS O-acetylase OafA/YrhL
MNSDKNLTQRFDFIDSLRGIAALLVVVQHYFVPMLGGARGNFWLHYIFEPGKAGVIWFFMISGFLIPVSLKNEAGGLNRFVISRFFRLYPVYWLSIFGLLAAMNFAGAALPPIKQTLFNFTMFQAAFGIQDIGVVYWTLFIELVFYLICALAHTAKLLDKLQFKLMMSVLFLMIAMTIGILRAIFNQKLPVVFPLALSLMFFGSIWREYLVGTTEIARKYTGASLALYCVVMPLTFYMAYRKDMGFAETWTRYAITYAVAISTFLFFTLKFRIAGRMWVWLGTISYSIYLFHPIVLMALEPLLTPLGFPIIFNRAMSVAVTLIVAHFLYTMIEQRFIHIGRTLSKKKLHASNGSNDEKSVSAQSEPAPD